MNSLAFEIVAVGGTGGSSENDQRHAGQCWLLPDFFYGLTSIHSWHVHVHDDEAGKPVFGHGLVQKIQSLPTIMRFFDGEGVILGTNDLTHEKLIVFIVVNTKNGGNK